MNKNKRKKQKLLFKWKMDCKSDGKGNRKKAIKTIQVSTSRSYGRRKGREGIENGEKIRRGRMSGSTSGSNNDILNSFHGKSYVHGKKI